MKTHKSCWCRKLTSVWSRKGNLPVHRKEEVDQGIDGLVDDLSSWVLGLMAMIPGDIWWSSATLNPEFLTHPSLSWWSNDPQDSLVLLDFCQILYLKNVYPLRAPPHDPGPKPTAKAWASQGWASPPECLLLKVQTLCTSLLIKVLWIFFWNLKICILCSDLGLPCAFSVTKRNELDF